MNEVKIRAWNKIHKVMLNWDELQSLMHGKVVVKNTGKYELEILGNPFKTDAYVFMHSIGRKDDEGIDMYDKDILIFNHYQSTGIDHFRLISWDHRSFSFLGIDFLHDCIEEPGNVYEIPAHSVNVAGNSFETPELIKELGFTGGDL